MWHTDTHQKHNNGHSHHLSTNIQTCVYRHKQIPWRRWRHSSHLVRSQPSDYSSGQLSISRRKKKRKEKENTESLFEPDKTAVQMMIKCVCVDWERSVRISPHLALPIVLVRCYHFTFNSNLIFHPSERIQQTWTLLHNALTSSDVGGNIDWHIAGVATIETSHRKLWRAHTDIEWERYVPSGAMKRRQ